MRTNRPVSQGDRSAWLSVVVSHSGKQHAYRHARAMQRLGFLNRFVTSSYYAPSRWPDRVMARFGYLDRYLQRRHLIGLADRVVRQPLFELPEVLCRATIGNGRLATDLMLRRDSLFDRWVAAFVLKQAAGANTFWGFQGSCCKSLSSARDRGMTAVLELASGHAPAAERILGHERERHPEWADSLSNAGFPRWYAHRLEEETRHADFCIAASSFTRATLNEAGVPDRKILMLPLGADLSMFTFAPRSLRSPFQILFVGSVGQRKGIGYLLDAYKRIRSRHTRLVVVGPMIGSGRAFRDRARDVEYVGRVDTQTVVDYMHRSHVLVLPSLFEGFGLVIVEAMATGMPVIASTHSAGPDIIREGVDGHVLRPDDTEGLADRLARLAGNRQRVSEMGVHAAQCAAQYGWESHTQRLLALCSTLVDHRRGTDSGLAPSDTLQRGIVHGHGTSKVCPSSPLLAVTR